MKREIGVTNQRATQPGSKLDGAIITGLLAAVVFTSLAHGAVEAWSAALFELIVVALIVLWATKSVVEKRFELRAPLALLPLVALFLIGLAQSVAWRDAGGMRESLSFDVEATRSATTMIFFLLVCFAAGASFLAAGERVSRVANFLIIFGLALAVFSMIQHFAWDGRFYWIRPTARDNVFGPFVNRNHYAGLMEMLAPLPLALVAGRGARAEAKLFYGFAAAIMGLSVIVSLSRGGMISLAAGVAFVLLMMFHRSISPVRSRASGELQATNRSLLSPVLIAVAVIAAILVGVLWIGPDPVIDRIAQTVTDASSKDANFLSREWIWRDTWTIFSSHPMLGAGLGSFQTVYPMYGHGDGRLVVAQSHNDYLQILSDAGIVGGLAALAFIAFALREVMRGMRHREPHLAAIAVGSGGGIFAMMVHSLFDFNLQIPSNALLFLLLVSVVSCIGAIPVPESKGHALGLKAPASAAVSAREVSS